MAVAAAARRLTGPPPAARLQSTPTSLWDVGRWRRAAVGVGLAVILGGLVGCGDKNGGGNGIGNGTVDENGPSESPVPVVAVFPSQVTVAKGQTVTFAATVDGSAGPVVWSVEGGAAQGTVDSLGTYTAPPTVSDQPVIVRATSASDSRGTATASVRLVVGGALTVNQNQALSPAGTRANTFSGGQRSVAVFGSTVYLVWNDDREGQGNEDVYLAVSRDRGQTFTGPALRVNDDNGTAPQRAPSVAVDGMGRAVIAWLDGRHDPTPNDAELLFDVYIATVNASGSGPVTVGGNQRVTIAGTPEERDPSVALALAPSGNLYLAWGDGSGGDTDILVAKGTRNASGGFDIAQPPTRANDNTFSDQSRPTVAVDAAESLLVAWNDRRSGDQDVYWRRGRFLPAGGVAWTTSPEVRVNLGVDGDQTSPSVAWSQDGGAHIAWSQQKGLLGRRRLFFATSLQENLAVASNREVIDSTTVADQNFPSLAVDGAEVTIAFADNRKCTGDPQTPCPEDPNGTGPTDVYVVRSLDGGATFFPSVRLNNDQTSSPHGRPSVALDDVGRAYAIWTDDRNGSSQAFMTRAE
ncbi:MAG: hypothetical protein AB1451_13080 [Nitrospirota bacterium]